MSLTIICPSCGAQMQTNERAVGRKVRCPACHQAIRVMTDQVQPGAAPPPPAPPTAPAFTGLEPASPPAPASPPQRPQSTSVLLDYLLFRRMIAPIVIQILFWFGVVGCVLFGGISVSAGLSDLVSGKSTTAEFKPVAVELRQARLDPQLAAQLEEMQTATRRGGGWVALATGLIAMFVGPLAVRLYCEVLIVLFRINDTLRDMVDRTQ